MERLSTPTVRRVLALAVLVIAVSSACDGGGLGGDSGWESLGPEGGAVFSLTVDPSDPSTVYAGAYGGVLKTTDGGGRWTSAGTGRASGVFAVAVDPKEPATVYAGTQAGVVVSDDGGESWHEAGSGSDEASVAALVVDPIDPRTVYAGTGPGLFAIFGDALPGVLRTTDGGHTWQPASAGLPREPGDMFLGGGGYPAIQALVLLPDDHETVYAGTSDGLFRSRDAAAHWERAPLREPVNALAAAAAAPETLYAAGEAVVHRSTDGGLTWAVRGRLDGIVRLVVDPDTPQTLYAATTSGVWRSDDEGANWTRAGLDGDLVPAIAISSEPSSEGALLAGTVEEGVQTSADGGGSWHPANTGLTAVALLTVASDPKSPGSIYVGSMFNGIQSSEEGGTTWATGEGLEDLGPAELVSDLLIDPATPGRIYATSGSTVLRSDDDGDSWRRLDAGYAPGNVGALAFAAPDGGELLAAFGDSLFSTEDGGDTWHEVGQGLSTHDDVTALAVDPRDPRILYAGTGEGLEKSSDGGASWTPAHMGLSCDGVGSSADCAMTHEIVADPESTQTLYAATAEGMYKTTDGGASWRPAGSGLPEHVAVLSLLLEPRSRATLYAGTTDGVFRSDDYAATWTELEGLGGLSVTGLSLQEEGSRLFAATLGGAHARGVAPPSSAAAPEAERDPALGPAVSLASSSVFAVALEPQRPDTVYAGTADGVVKTIDGGHLWRHTGVAGELIVDVDVDPTDSERVYAVSSSGDVFKSSDAGGSWVMSIACAGCELGRLSQVGAVAIDPQRADTLYAGMYGGIARSSDAGATWQSVERGLPERPGIEVVAVDPRTPETVYAGGYAGLFKTSDSGATWRRLDLRPFVSAIAIDPSDSRTLYATADYALVKSTDGGDTWRTLSIDGDEDGSAEALALDPDEPDIVYVALADASIGGRGLLFTSTDGGLTWTRVEPGGRTEVHAMTVAPGTGTLYAGTQGSGVLVLDP